MNGLKTGGRRRGTPNRATAARQAEIATSGLTPLDYLLAVMRGENLGLEMRLEAAKAAAPYVHPKLAAIDTTHRGPDGGVLEVRWKGFPVEPIVPPDEHDTMERGPDGVPRLRRAQ
jgi:hypothetical protein